MYLLHSTTTTTTTSQSLRPMSRRARLANVAILLATPTPHDDSVANHTLLGIESQRPIARIHARCAQSLIHSLQLRGPAEASADSTTSDIRQSAWFTTTASC